MESVVLVFSRQQDQANHGNRHRGALSQHDISGVCNARGDTREQMTSEANRRREHECVQAGIVKSIFHR